MLKLSILAVGVKMPYWVDEATQEYLKRIPSDFLKIQLKEIKPEPRNSHPHTEKIMQAEAKRILQQTPPQFYVLDEKGASHTSVEFAKNLSNWTLEHEELGLIIGGPDGLCPSLKASALGSICLSHFTLPHGMVRVILAEQLYRAWSILHDHPYHRN